MTNKYLREKNRKERGKWEAIRNIARYEKECGVCITRFATEEELKHTENKMIPKIRKV